MSSCNFFPSLCSENGIFTSLKNERTNEARKKERCRFERTYSFCRPRTLGFSLKLERMRKKSCEKERKSKRKKERMKERKNKKERESERKRKKKKERERGRERN